MKPDRPLKPWERAVYCIFLIAFAIIVGGFLIGQGLHNSGMIP